MPTEHLDCSPTALSAGEQTSARVVASDSPHLSWQLPAGTVTQQGYELEATISTPGAETHQRTSVHQHTPQHRNLAWPWAPLASRSRVRWRVRIRGDDEGEWSEWSDWCPFQAPLLASGDWAGQWISPDEQEITEDRPAYVLGREFFLDVAPEEARLYATALGVYEVFLNGRRVGDRELTPGSSNYDETLYAQVYDVAAHLRAGQNQIEIVLSDGWFRGRNGGMQRQNAWGATTAALAQLEVDTDDGPKNVIATDGAWTSQIGSITRADLMTGQTTDFLRTVSAPAPVAVGVVDPPVPGWSPAPAPQRVGELTPVAIVEISAGVSVVDFGQNISGWVRLSDLGPDGSVTVLEFGEHVDPAGDLTTGHLDIVTPDGTRVPYDSIDRVIAGPAGDVFEPRHTVRGFRYVRVQHPGRTLDPAQVTAVVVHSDLARTGWFECSDPEVNRLHEAALWSFRGNVVDVPTDCPTRERSGWTGDFQVFAPTAALLYDIDGFARKWLEAVRDDQYADGSLAMFSPDSERMKHSDDPLRIAGGSAGWGDAAVYVPWTLYQTYGDVVVLEESWDMMRFWVEFALRAARDGRHPSRITRSPEPLPHEQFLWDATFHFGEWLEPTRRTGTTDPAAEYQAFLTADKGEVATAYLHRSTQLLGLMAGILGRAADADRYGRLAEQIRSAWRTEFLLGGGRTGLDTQAGYVRALAFDLVPADQRAVAAERLVQLVDQADDHLTTGFLSTGLLLPVLADAGHLAVAYRLLLQHGTPSWLGMLDRGATTVWEEWDGVDEDGTASASLNHYSKGAVISFLYSHVAGLRQSPTSVGWRDLEIRPAVGGGITSASARFLAPNGPIAVSWQLRGDTLELDATVPPGSTATVYLPDDTTTTVGPGDHHLSCPAPQHA